MSNHAVTVRLDPEDPHLRHAVTQILDERLTHIVDTWAARVAAAGWPDAADWMRREARS